MNTFESTPKQLVPQCFRSVDKLANGMLLPPTGEEWGEGGRAN